MFTSQMGSWWLPSHFIGNEPFSEIVIEPHAGGRWFAEGAEQTRVELEHRGIEGLGGEAAELRSAFDGVGGWAGLLAAYSRALG